MKQQTTSAKEAGSRAPARRAAPSQAPRPQSPGRANGRKKEPRGSPPGLFLVGPDGQPADLERYPVAGARFWDVEKLSFDPRNARQHDQRNIDLIKASLSRYGQRKNIVVTADGIVKAGNGTLEAARQLGWKWIVGAPAPAKEIDARGYALVDNRSSDLSYFGADTLGRELGALAAAGEDLAGIGWEPTEALVYLGVQEGVGPDRDEWQGMPEFNQGDETAFKRIVVHFKDQKAVDAFAKTVGRKIDESTRYMWFPEAKIGRFAHKRYGQE